MEIKDEETTERMEIKDEENTERTLSGLFTRVAFMIGVAFSIFQLVAVSFTVLDPWKLRSAHILFSTVLVFILYGGGSKSISGNKSSEGRISSLDFFWILLAILPVAWIWIDYENLIYRVEVSPEWMDILMGCAIFLVILEAGRRLQGLILPVICLIITLYTILGGYIPGVLGHHGFSFTDTIAYLYGQEAIFSQPLGASSTYIMLFVMFGVFLQNSGVGKFIIDFAYSVAGRTRGGPAKVAIVASGLFGTISGSAVSNVVTTGVFTIPMMKSVGFRSFFAGAVEAVASTGGQIMPPVMGAVAFVMSEMTGSPYLEICKMAIFPAIFYYLAIFMQVDFNARNMGLIGLPKDQLPQLTIILRKNGHLIIPVVVLLYFLIIAGVSPLRSAFFALLATVPVSWLTTETRLGPKKILDSLYSSAKSILPIAIPCAEAGIIVGAFNMTGIGLKFSNLIIAYSGGNLWAALLLTAIVCLILGIGLPTIPAYIICAVATVPALVKLGVPEPVAHLFILYFAVISTITPPVGNAYYAAAAIAKSEPQKTGLQACRLGIVGFVIPFIFVSSPALLTLGNFTEIIFALFYTLLCVIALAKGFEDKNCTILERILFLAIALILVVSSPQGILHSFSIGGFFFLILMRWFLNRRVRAIPGS